MQEVAFSDHQYFLKTYDKLYKRYGHKFFVIQNQKIIGIYDDRLTAFKETYNLYPAGDFIIEECIGDRSEKTMCSLSIWIN